MSNIIRNMGAPRVAPSSSLLPGRRIHLIDIENLCGLSQPTEMDVAHSKLQYETEIGINSSDLVVIASSRGNLLSASSGWPGVRYLTQDGKDGADICLSEVMKEERLSLRFDQVFLVSGDGGLAPCVARLAEEGLYTVVVSQQERLSRKLRLAAHACIVLTPDLQEIA